MMFLIDFQWQRICWSGKVSANDIYNISTTKEIPVTAESTNAEAEAMKLGPMDGGRELKEIKTISMLYLAQTDRKTMSRLSKPGSSGRSRGCRCGPTQADQVGCTGQAWKKKGESISYF